MTTLDNLSIAFTVSVLFVWHNIQTGKYISLEDFLSKNYLSILDIKLNGNTLDLSKDPQPYKINIETVTSDKNLIIINSNIYHLEKNNYGSINYNYSFF